MEEWGVIGYGICVDDIPGKSISFERLESLCKLSEETYKVFVQGIVDYAEALNGEPVTDLESSFNVVIQQGNVDEFLEGFEGEYCGENGLGWLLRSVIEDVEDVIIEYTENYDNKKFLLLTPSYPWNKISEREKSLTEEDVCEMFLKYVHIFTDEDIAVEERNIVNCG